VTHQPESPAGSEAGQAARKVRADAARNVGALLEAAKAEFAASAVDVPMREIAARAGVGVGTLYRHFPTRADLIVAVFRHEVDACADAAEDLTARYEPLEALTRWLLRFTDFVATKRGLATALHSGDPAYDALPGYFTGRLGPTLQGLLDRAVADAQIRSDVDAEELLAVVSRLCMPGSADDGLDQSHRMVMLVVDGLRFGAARNG
jgi:AcrR family transcriptional regulator